MPDDVLTRLHRYCADLEAVLAVQSVQVATLQEQVTRLEKALDDARLELKTHRADMRSVLALLCEDCAGKVRGLTRG